MNFTKGPLVGPEDDYVPEARQTSKRRSWNNDTTTDPRGVSPLQQDKFYFVSRRKPVVVTVTGETLWAETTPILVRGADLVSPAEGPDNGPPQMQEVVPIAHGEEMLIICAAVEAPPLVPPRITP
ncbi:MAG: hypothetical protein PHQ12_11925 [Chthoniobacteraceae bacterium]|nr:hypothetical protein [Chthoniobacteraceae bacterium]